MIASENSRIGANVESTNPLFNEGLRAGLALLWRAYVCAQAADTNVWELALRTGKLYEAGMTSSDLRWMVAKGFAAPRQESLGSNETPRSFHPSKGHFFNESTCLVLTPFGAALAEHVFGKIAQWPQAKLPALVAVAAENSVFAGARQAVDEINSLATTVVKPSWNAIRRELTWSGMIVKRFRVPAQNQEKILSVFEENGWFEHIHDPLPVTYDIDAPTRLHDAINRLNRCQINPLLRFHGDGRGTGVLWELRQPNGFV
jgi:hypothetical protein